MLCREAKRRLTGSIRDISKLTADRELMEHIRFCPSCNREKELFGILQKLLETGSMDDLSNILPMQEQRFEVEKKIANRSGERKATGKKRRLVFKPIYGLGILAVLIFFILIPFTYYEVIGYEVALGGIDPELAESDEIVCDMLYELGLGDAAVDLHGCDMTCSLVIFDLKSRQEAEIVVAAFSALNVEKMTADVRPVRTPVSGTLFNRANEKLGL